MRKGLLLTAVLALVLSCSIALAASKATPPPPPNGEEPIGLLYLFQKTPLPADPASGPWPIVPGGAWGMLRYSLWGEEFSFDFKGRQLTPGTPYMLIYYPDPWPGNGLICLAAGRANPAGNLSLVAEEFELGTSLPARYDANFSAVFPSGAVGAKLWLVLASDVDCTAKHMIGWTPAKYLFEFNLINFELRPE